MTSAAAKKILENEIKNLNLDIPVTVFQYAFDRKTATDYLIQNPGVPFILRDSSVNGSFALDIPTADRTDCIHVLVKVNESDSCIKLGNYADNEFTETNTLKGYFASSWDPVQKRLKTKAELELEIAKECWHQFKSSLPLNQKVAVFSTQSMEQQKVAFTADEARDYFEKHRLILEQPGDGHTGFTMARVLNAPFVVLRSKENRELANKKLKDHVGNNGLLIITGHGSQDGDVIQGGYVHVDAIQEKDLFIKQMLSVPQIQRDSRDIVNAAMDAGLKNGDKITILLSICFGASDTAGTGNSFAHKLAREFATQGISSTIIATDKPFRRFGTKVIKDNELIFDNRMGMAAEDVHIFSTTVKEPTTNPEIKIYKPNETVKLTSKGVEFISPANKTNVGELTRIQAQMLLEEQLRQQKKQEALLQKQKEQAALLQKQKEQEALLQKQKEQEALLQKQKEQETLLQKQKEQEALLQKQKEQEALLQKQKEQETLLQKQKEQEVLLHKQKEQEALLQKQNEQEELEKQQLEVEFRQPPLEQRSNEVLNQVPKVSKEQITVSALGRQNEGTIRQIKDQSQHTGSRGSEETPGEKSFNKQLVLLRNKGNELKRRRNKINPAQNISEFIALDNAYIAAKQLHQKLRSEGIIYFNNPTGATYQSFRTNCNRYINDAHKVLDKHRGWSEFLINLAIGILTAAVGLLVKGSINLANNKSFFFVHQTDSSRRIDAIERTIEEIKPYMG